MIGMLLLSNCVIYEYMQLKLEFVLVLKIAYIIKKKFVAQNKVSGRFTNKTFVVKNLYYDIHSFIGMQRTVYDRAM